LQFFKKNLHKSAIVSRSHADDMTPVATKSPSQSVERVQNNAVNDTTRVMLKKKDEEETSPMIRSQNTGNKLRIVTMTKVM
uniref:Ovule protein n=1 Tax=Haemonchus placei TaxID=6290 RepID=A0A0N4VSB8_HAEPC